MKTIKKKERLQTHTLTILKRPNIEFCMQHTCLKLKLFLTTWNKILLFKTCTDNNYRI